MKVASITALSTSAIAGFATNQIIALSTAQIAALAPTQVCALSTTQKAAMSTAQLAHLQAGTPLVLDLNGSGMLSQGIDAGVKFDLFANGQPSNTGWTAPGEGFLVLDRNHDGQVNDGTELFGDATVLSNGQKAANGFAALADLDSNHDGVINSLDNHFADLKVWTDVNSNGVTDPGEMHTLAELGIQSLNLNAVGADQADNGNAVGLVSSYQTTDGRSHTLADVWFATSAPGVADAQTKGLQAGVADMVDAMANYQHGHGRGHAIPRLAGNDPTAAALQSSTTGAGSAMAAQLADVLNQFDTAGPGGAGSPVRHLAVAGLSGTAPTKSTDALAGILGVDKA